MLVPTYKTSYIRNFKPLAIFCGYTAWFVSDLVGNPDDRFSHNEAQVLVYDGFYALEKARGSHQGNCQGTVPCTSNKSVYCRPPYTPLLNEPRCEKTGLRGFRPGPTQTGLYSHIR